MIGPARAAQAFNAYEALLLSAPDSDTLFEVIRQADNDERLSRRQQEALDAIAYIRGRLLKWGVPGP